MILFFLGFPFVFFDYTYAFGNHVINFIPDFIGYIMFIFGCIGMRKENSHFIHVRNLSIFLGVWSIVATVVQAIGISIPTIWTTIIDIAASLLMLLMAYKLYEGVRFLERSIERPIGATQLSYTWIALSAGKLIHYFAYIFENTTFDRIFTLLEVLCFLTFEYALFYIVVALRRKPKQQ